MLIVSLTQSEIVDAEAKAGKSLRCARCNGLMGRCVKGAFRIAGHYVHTKCAKVILQDHPTVGKMPDSEAPKLFSAVFAEYRRFLTGASIQGKGGITKPGAEMKRPSPLW